MAGRTQIVAQCGTPGREAGRVANTTAPPMARWGYHESAAVSVAHNYVRAEVPRSLTAERTAPVITPDPAGKWNHKKSETSWQSDTPCRERAARPGAGTTERADMQTSGKGRG